MNLLYTLSKAHLGYLHLDRASLRCWISLLESSSPVQTVFALWVRVPMTLLGRQFVMTIPLQVLVSMGGFSIHRNRKVIICLRYDQGIKEWDGTILLIIFYCKLYCWIYFIYVIQEYLFWDSCWMTKVSSTSPYQCLGGLRQYGGLLFQNTPCVSLL